MYVIFQNHPKYTNSIKAKKQKYFDERRTTTLVAPVYVNAKQPRTYGDDTLKIDCGSLQVPDLTEYMAKINKLI